MIKIQAISPDLEKQAAKLRAFPEIYKQYFRPALKQGTKITDSSIRGLLPHGVTGLLASTFGSKVSGSGLSLSGRIGWLDSSDPWYPNIVEYGARSHLLSKGSSVRSKSKFASFQESVAQGTTGSGAHISMAGIGWRTFEGGIHPGFGPRHFMQNGWSNTAPQVRTLLDNASVQVSNALAV